MLHTPFFATIFSLNCSLLLLHLSDGTDIRDRLGTMVHPLMEAIQSNFSSLLIPHQDLCIDEPMMPWKGQLSFRQYIPSKRHRFGVKLFVLRDVKTSRILKFTVYTGSTTDLTMVKELGFS